MSETNFKIKTVLTIAMMLTLGMLLQSIVVIFLGVRTSIREDIAWAKQVLRSDSLSVELNEYSGINRHLSLLPVSADESTQIFSCIYFEPLGKQVQKQTSCRYTAKLYTLSQQAKERRQTIVGFAGGGWNTFFFWNEVVLIAVPQINGKGQMVGSILAERSLLPIYARYEENMKFIFCYLLVNVLLFSILSFFRISPLFFKPLDSLVQKAESYQPDEQSLFMVSENESPFRKLSIRLNTLFERIERDNRTLRQNVSELELVNAELKEKNNLVIRSEKLATAGRLSAGLAHEIGNPLSIIQGYVELLGSDDLNIDEKNTFSERAQQELDRIKRLIKQLLDFSRPSDQEAELVSINSLIKNVVDFVSIEKGFDANSISLKLLVEADSIVVDEDALRQVLINCIFNAVDATSSLECRKRDIVISTSQEKHGSLFVINVQDNGMGIDEEQLQYIFDPFFTTKEVGRGTGLGLFVCHTLMGRLNGTIILTNRSSNGVRAQITLPL